MANHTSRRLKEVHYRTVAELEWMYEPLKGQPAAPSADKRRATFLLNRLVKEAGINREGMTRRQMYLESIRAIVKATGIDTSLAASQVQKVAMDWRELRFRISQRNKQTAAASIGEESTAPASTDKEILASISEDNHSLAMFGIFAGDTVDGEEIKVEEMQAGDLVVVRHKETREWSGVGYFVSVDAKHFHIAEGDAHTYHYENGGYWQVYRLTTITRRIAIQRGSSADIERCQREAQIKTLQSRAAKLTSNDEESEKFQVLKQIYDLEREANTDTEEWPDVIAA